MANAWDQKLKTFLNKTGEDFKRAGNDMKEEAQRLMKEVKDPQGQEKLKEGLKEFGGWAKKTAVEMAELAEGGFKKAETAFRQAADNWAPQPGATGTPSSDAAAAPDAEAAPTATPPGPPPEMPSPAPSAPPAAAKKTVGRKKAPGAAAKAKPAGKKTIGKKPAAKPPSGGDEG